MVAGKAQRIALMSIHPKYAHAILDGVKTVEFRKRPLSDDVTHIVIYSTAPEQSVIGYFTIERQEVGSPQRLWKKYAECGVIKREDFFDYYSGHDTGIGICIGSVTRLRRSLSLRSDLGIRYPPQSYQYIDHNAFETVVASESASFGINT
jgi:predicted transcriptional regulator